MSNNSYNFNVGEFAFFNDVDASNTVDDKPIHYWVNQQDRTVPSDAGYVALINCINITVQNLNLTNNRQGVLLTSTTNSKIINNNVTNNYFGIQLRKSSNNTISRNNIANNDDGIRLLSSSGNAILGNRITRNYFGILVGGLDNNLSGNDITNNFFGIRVQGCSNCIISENNVTNNYFGIRLRESSSNTIYHNNFVDNKYQLSTVESEDVWDDGYPSGGNYWSDYVDVDRCWGPHQNETGSDGIWDHPYIIDVNNKDNYPLALEHELAVLLIASPHNLIDRTSLLRATVYNRGSSNETDVELQLLINGSLVANVTIPELTSGSTYTLNYLWTPTVEGTYNVTAYAPPLPGEAFTTSNVAMKDVSVVTTIVGTYISVEPHVNTGVNFTVTAWVSNVVDLMGFQVALYYDASVINMTSASLPADHVLAGQPGYPLGPAYDYFDSWEVGMVAFSPYWWATPFNGTGKLAVFEFEIIAEPPEGGSLTSPLIISYEPTGAPPYETKLRNSTEGRISFVGIDGYFEYPSSLPGDLNSDGLVDIDDIMVAALSFGSYPEHPRWNPIADLTKDGIVDIDDVMLVAIHFGEHI